VAALWRIQFAGDTTMRGMAKVSVFAFNAWSQRRGENVRARRLATRERIAQYGGAVIEHTERLIDEADLDADYRYPPFIVPGDYVLLQTIQNALDQNVNHSVIGIDIDRLLAQGLLEQRGVTVRLSTKGLDTLRMCGA
jgi:hypothetical protein